MPDENNKEYIKQFAYPNFMPIKDIWAWLIIWLCFLGIFAVIASALLNFWILGLVFVIYAVYKIARLSKASVPLKKGATICSSVVKVEQLTANRASGATRENIMRFNLVPKPKDLKLYIDNKSNRNVLIVGTAGQGKSLLTRYLLELFKNPKIIFSFKPNDEYLKMGYEIVEASKALPNAFRDIEAFVNAFTITFPVASVGITAQYIPSYVREIGKVSQNWPEFNKNIDAEISHTKDNVQKSALLYIKEHSKALFSDKIGAVLEIKHDIVFDFSTLNEDAKTFYSEIVLRQVWKDLTAYKIKDVIICIDEAHRLLKNFDKYESIYVEMSREIRAFGMIWTTTQNFTDIPNHIRNQFATQFIFNTNHKDDLASLKIIDDKLAWSVPSLPKYCFTEARYSDMRHVIPEFTLYNYNPTDKKRRYVEGIISKPQDKPKSIIYNDEVWTILNEKGMSYNYQMSKIIAEKYNIKTNIAKLRVLRAIDKFTREGKIGSIMIWRNNKEIPAYYIKDVNESGLHKGMIEEIINLLNIKGIKVLKIAQSGGKSQPDIKTPEFDIEIETGLKHSKTDLKDRISYSKRHIVVVVIDETAKKKYGFLQSKQVDIIILTKFGVFLNEFQTKPYSQDAVK